AQWAAFAEKIAAYSQMLWPVPDHWANEQAAAFPVNYFTAYLAYWQAGMTAGSMLRPPMWGQPPSAVQRSEAPQPVPGQPVQGEPVWGRVSHPARGSETPQRTPRVLIHAVAGGVGTAAVQIGKLLGIEV